MLTDNEMRNRCNRSASSFFNSIIFNNMSKISLNSIASKMTQNEMKQVLGGSGDYDCASLSTCTNYGCTKSNGAGGACKTAPVSLRCICW